MSVATIYELKTGDKFYIPSSFFSPKYGPFKKIENETPIALYSLALFINGDIWPMHHQTQCEVITDYIEELDE